MEIQRESSRRIVFKLGNEKFKFDKTEENAKMIADMRQACVQPSSFVPLLNQVVSSLPPSTTDVPSLPDPLESTLQRPKVTLPLSEQEKRSKRYQAKKAELLEKGKPTYYQENKEKCLKYHQEYYEVHKVLEVR